MNYRYICVFDLETTSKYPNVALPVEFACKIYNPYTYEPVPNGEFSSGLMRPADLSIVEPEALEITKIKLSDLEKAPLIDIIWPKCVDFVTQFNPKKDSWNCPIAAGHNIDGFDIPIVNRTNQLYGDKKEKTVCFNNFMSFDLMKIIFAWFNGTKELPNYKLDTLRDYFGISKDGSHRALKDVQDTGSILMRFLKYKKNSIIKGNLKLKGCFKKDNNV